MRIVFFGTPEFAVPSLQALLRARYSVVGVVTQPDKPQGRSRSTLVAPPVKLAAESAGLPVLQPVRPLGDVFLRPGVLTLPARGMINVHASLLPRFRGAAPIQHAIMAGEVETGVSIMQMEEGLDSGPVLLRVATPIGRDETAGGLAERLAEIGADALTETLALVGAGRGRALPQEAAGATYAPKIDREQARLDWTRDAEALARQVRAFDPAPGAWTTLGDASLKLFGATTAAGRGDAGAVLEAGERLVVACGNGALALREVQPAGKTRLPVEAWVRGRGVSVGDRLA
jgi:methionyl-tRNA formyltransferase